MTKMGMKIFVLFLTLRAVVSSELLIESLSQEMVDYINSLNTTWTAGRNFENVSMDYIVGLMGSDMNYTHELPTLTHYEEDPVPDSFDSRDKWPNCWTIGYIRNQGGCGSCWAIAAVEAMSDRHCIHSQGKIIVELSVEDILSCCTFCGHGCKGGIPERAWEYWKDFGVVTGGSYGSSHGCKPYVIEPCSLGSKSKCGLVPTPPCVGNCIEGFPLSYEKDKHHGRIVYGIPDSPQSIQLEILNKGPIEASFRVFDDFLHYKHGVYYHVTGRLRGGHAVRLLGWGVENGTPYWLAANSWGSEWGEKGFFKIRRGVDECGIEKYLVAGIPKLDEET